jgi:hypothetical protein
MSMMVFKHAPKHSTFGGCAVRFKVTVLLLSMAAQLAVLPTPHEITTEKVETTDIQLC